MKRRHLLLILLLLLLLGGLLLVPQVRWPLYGFLRGEAFYQGMPTSWWANEIEVKYHPIVFTGTVHVFGASVWIVHSPPSSWEQLLQQLAPGTNSNPSRNLITKSPLHSGDPDALPVLLALVQADSTKVRRVAISGLVAQGEAVPAIISALQQMRDDPDQAIRADVAAAFKELEFAGPGENIAK